MKIIINEILEKEAMDYAVLSKSFTSNRHDFHEGGLDAKQRKMFEGKLGEKAIKQFFIDNDIKFEEDKSSHEDADLYDFIVYDLENNPLKVDVKTRTKNFHIRTLEMVEQMKRKPKDIYFSVRLYETSPFSVEIIGYAKKEDFLRINRIENQGYLNNYVLYDKELSETTSIINKLRKNA
ncbi:MAG: hypothetical protein IPM47_18145 [Sphingobacteriales bacterium]|nr:MAG: hypothetical protein IPM47_18145 [Sphingobacteriales bacterium]